MLRSIIWVHLAFNKLTWKFQVEILQYVYQPIKNFLILNLNLFSKRTYLGKKYYKVKKKNKDRLKYA